MLRTFSNFPLSRTVSTLLTSDRVSYRLLITSFTKDSARKMISTERCKENAAYMAVDNHVKNDYVVGIGSGSTVVYVVQRIAERVMNEKLNITCIPTSFQSQSMIRNYKLPLGSLDETPVLNVVIDGADEVDKNLTLIKGGGGCLLQEKIVASCSDNLIIVADYNKKSQELGEKWTKGIPIEVVPVAYIPVTNKIIGLFGGEVDLRLAKMKAGPVITDNGNFLLDWKFVSGKKYDWEEVCKTIKLISGVVDVGLFVNMAKKAYFGMKDNSVFEL